MITKYNKNKVIVEFTEAYGSSEKGVSKLLSIKDATDLEKDGIVKITETYKPADTKSLIDRVEKLEKTVKKLEGMIGKEPKKSKKEKEVELKKDDQLQLKKEEENE